MASLQAQETRLTQLQDQLKEITRLKNMEPSVRKEIEKLEADVKELHAADKFHKKDRKNSEEEKPLVKSPIMCPKGPQSPAFGVTAKEEDPTKKRMKAINKKLQQITALRAKGDIASMDAEAKAKISSEAALKKELAALEAGGVYEPAASEAALKSAAEEPASAFLPTDPAEVEKKLKALRKKLQQIDKLKEGKDLDAEARDKVASESRLLQEVAALERGDQEVVYVVKDKYELMAEEKTELEKKHKALKKKLTQIEKLKEAKETLTAEATAKIDSQKAIQKEAHQMQERIAAINKEERARVEERLGWEAEQIKKGKK